MVRDDGGGGGGGGGMSVSIDHPTLKGAIDGLTGLAGRIESQRNVVRNGTPVSQPSLSDGTLGLTVQWLGDQEPMLQGLHDIAVLLSETGSTVASFFVGTGTTDIKELLGQTLAAQVQKGSPYEQVGQEDYLAILQKWQYDPATMAAFQTALGPEGTLRALSDWGQRDITRPGSEQPTDAQTALVEAMKQSLETANETGGFTEAQSTEFAHGLVAAATIPGEDYYGRGAYNPSGALTYLLYDGTFNDTFIKTVAEDLDQYERQDNDGTTGLWGRRPVQEVDFGKFMEYGTSRNSPSDNSDPMTGLMTAMSHNPAVALDFFSDDDAGDGETPRAQYYIKERNWDRDSYHGITQVLDAATTDPSVFDGTPEQQQHAAELASETVELFSERKNKDDLPGILSRDPQLGASEDLAHILSTYMPGVDKGIDATDDLSQTGAGEQRFDAFNANLDNVPVFDRDGLKNFVLMATATDEGLAEVANGVNHWRGENLGALADEMAANPGGDKEALRNGIQDDARVQGFLLSTMGEDKIHDAHEQDERTKATIDMFSDVVDLVPVPGMSQITDGIGKDVLSYAIGEGKGAGFDSLKEHLANAEDQAVGDYDARADATLERQKFTVAQLLSTRDLLGDEDAMSPATHSGTQVITYDQYAQLDDAGQNLVSSELFSADIGVGRYLNEADYREAYREMFEQGYFGKEG